MDLFERHERYIVLSDEFKNAVTENLTSLKFQIHDVIYCPGDQGKGIYFVDSGVFKNYILQDEKKITTSFVCETEVFIPTGLLSGLPVVEYTGFATNCQAYFLSKTTIFSLMDHHAEAKSFFLLLLELARLEGIGRELLLRVPLADARYHLFLEQKENLMLKVPFNKIASFLNMTNETFTRLRNKR